MPHIAKAIPESCGYSHRWEPAGGGVPPPTHTHPDGTHTNGVHTHTHTPGRGVYTHTHTPKWLHLSVLFAVRPLETHTQWSPAPRAGVCFLIPPGSRKKLGFSPWETKRPSQSLSMPQSRGAVIRAELQPTAHAELSPQNATIRQWPRSPSAPNWPQIPPCLLGPLLCSSKSLLVPPPHPCRGERKGVLSFTPLGSE